MKKILIFSLTILFFIISTPILKADPMNTKPQSDTKLRWADDNLIYTGEVNAWTLGVLLGVEDAAIDVDYFAGDTLRAIVARPDSTVSIFRSNDNGQTWLNVVEIYLSTGSITEPHIVHGTDSTYHIFLRDLYRIHTRAYRTSDDSYILGTADDMTLPDSVKNYSVCTNRSSTHDYSVFLVYHQGLGGRGLDRIRFTRTTDQGQNWSAPNTIQFVGSGYPDITYGGDSTLYLTFLFRPAGLNDDRILVRRSLDLGETWGAPFFIVEDTLPKMRPQIAAAYDGSGNVWTIWPRKDLLSANQDWDLYWSWSQDSASTWSTPAAVNSVVDSNEALPSIAVYDAFGSTNATPYVSFIKSYYDWTGNLSVRSFAWEGSDWSSDSIYADSNTVATKPIQTFVTGGEPAIAYVGPTSENVYFDSRTIPAGIDEKEYSPSNGEIECSIDKSVITGRAILKYTLSGETNVDISIANILGQKTATLFNGKQEKGEHTLSLSSKNLSQGIYFIVIETENGLEGIIKATVLK